MFPIWEKPQLTYDANMNDFIEAVDAQFTALGNTYAYSLTPVQIGEWIDGIPLWRLAFKIHCKDMTSADYGYMLGDQMISLDGYLPIKNIGTDVYVINAQCTYSPALVTNASPVDDAALMRESAPGNINFPIPDDVVSGMPEEWSADMTNGFYGIVEFATPESNIDK